MPEKSMNQPNPTFVSASFFGRALLPALVLGMGVLPCLCNAAPGADAETILEATGIKGGFVVHLLDDNAENPGALTGALRATDSYQVQGWSRNASVVTEARELLLQKGYGEVSVDVLRDDSGALPYIDNMVNLLVASDTEAQGTTEEEILRVLTPKGVAYLKQDDGSWKSLRKPRPTDIDDWTHFLHGPDGNAVAHDTAVDSPRHLQWVGSPKWSRHHDRMASMSALVSSNGRLFYIMDDGSRISIQLPSKWTLVGRDAFNGAILWKRDIPNWHSHLWPLKSGPTQLARRLVAVEDDVFCTLGIEAAVSQIDGTSGETVRVFEDSEGAEELVVADGILYCMAYKGESELRNFLPVHNTGDQARVRTDYRWNEEQRVVMAFDIKTGEKLWHHVSRVAPLTIASDGGKLYYHDGDVVVAHEPRSGEIAWKSDSSEIKEEVTFNFGPKLAIYKDVVIFAGGDRVMHALDAGTGVELWNSPHARGGYQSPEDLLIQKDLVWSAALTSGKDDGVFTGRNFRTGEIESQFAPDVETYWFHHRCYIAKATDKYLMPSRTGIEFIDTENKTWDINHWVRGGCLYGVMPANGLTYAPPHNCACYPEAKLYGFNALNSPNNTTTDSLVPEPVASRLVQGADFGNVPTGNESNSTDDWPTFRHDVARSGRTDHSVSPGVKESWSTEIGGNLSSVVIADGRLFVSQIDAHTVHALDADSGGKLWSFTAGGRVDSPPALYQGAAIFGSRDGWVYCVNAETGALAWKFRASPNDRRMMAFEQIESLWPVHGNVLVQDGQVYVVSGRSTFLDGGLRMYRLDPATGEVLGETIMDQNDPHTGEHLQTHIKTLQMPVGLPDILSSSGGYIYMRSQKFDLAGERLEIGPHSGDAAEQGGTQAGAEGHLFAPMSFLDDTWFHRSYWVYGRSFAGGHNGYYQAGKHTPSGRILVFGKDKVYGFGRKPEYLKWTTTMEHQLFSAPLESPDRPTSVTSAEKRRGEPVHSTITFENTKSVDPTGKALSISAWVKPEGNRGAIISRGGQLEGFALSLVAGRPTFSYRSGGDLVEVAMKNKIPRGEWTHLAGVLGEDRKLTLYLNGKAIPATAKAQQFITKDPNQPLNIGMDTTNAVGSYADNFAFNGLIDEARVFFGELSAEEVAAHAAANDGSAPAANATLIVYTSFDDKTASDRSGMGNHGTLSNVKALSGGKIGGALHFAGNSGKKAAGKIPANATLVQFNWTEDIPLLARAMLLADKTLFVVGPPDLMDEEETFAKLTEGDEEVQKIIAAQDSALEGSEGAILWAVDADTGKQLARLEVDSLPVWDGMAAAGKKLFLSTTDGKVVCFGE